MNVIDKNILTVKSSVSWVLCNFAKELQSRAEYPNRSKERKLYHRHGMKRLTLTRTENNERFQFLKHVMTLQTENRKLCAALGLIYLNRMLSFRAVLFCELKARAVVFFQNSLRKYLSVVC